MRRDLLAALSALVLLFVAMAPASALEPWRLVVRVDGQVESRQAVPGGWSPVWRSRLLSDGDYARTLQASRARIELADQSTFTIGAQTTVEMSKFELTPRGRTVLFHLEVGRIRARVAKLVGRRSRFEVQTVNGVLSARGTDFYVEQLAGLGATLMMVFAGRVDAASAIAHRTFYGGDYGIIEAGGRIRFDPPDLSPAEGGLLGRKGADADLRLPDLDEAGAFGAPGPPGSATEGRRPPPIFSPGSTAPGSLPGSSGSSPGSSGPPPGPPPSHPPGSR